MPFPAQSVDATARYHLTDCRFRFVCFAFFVYRVGSRFDFVLMGMMDRVGECSLCSENGVMLELGDGFFDIKTRKKNKNHEYASK